MYAFKRLLHTPSERLRSMCETHDPVNPRRGDEYVRWLQELRQGSRARPVGSLRGRNRQNERRAAIRQSRRDA